MPRPLSTKPNIPHASIDRRRMASQLIDRWACLIIGYWIERRRQRAIASLNSHLQRDIGHSPVRSELSAGERAFNLQLLRNP